MMTNRTIHEKPAGSLPTTWELRTYDVWSNAEDGWEVNDSYSAGTVELRIPQTRYNAGQLTPVPHDWPVQPLRQGQHANNPATCGTCKRSWDDGIVTGMTPTPSARCPFEQFHASTEFLGAYPTDRQIKLAFGVTCRIDTDGDDLYIAVNRASDGYPIGEMHCTSHASLSPVRKLEVSK
jgi:hypothetical protein